MYKSVLEMFGDVEAETNKQKQIELLQSYATNAQFVLFLRYAFFNVRKSTFTQIPLYKPNMVEPTFSYIKIENAIARLRFFFDGSDYIISHQKREDRLASILEELSWTESAQYEMLILNTFKSITVSKELILEAVPTMVEMT
jgi:hypothetical protein